MVRKGEMTDRRQIIDKGVRTMKAHIEYDDFGEYIEVLEEDVMFRETDPVPAEKGGLSVMKKMLQRVMLIVAAVTVMFCSSSYAAGPCRYGDVAGRATGRIAETDILILPTEKMP